MRVANIVVGCVLLEPALSCRSALPCRVTSFKTLCWCVLLLWCVVLGRTCSYGLAPTPFQPLLLLLPVCCCQWYTQTVLHVGSGRSHEHPVEEPDELMGLQGLWISTCCSAVALVVWWLYLGACWDFLRVI